MVAAQRGDFACRRGWRKGKGPNKDRWPVRRVLSSPPVGPRPRQGHALPQDEPHVPRLSIGRRDGREGGSSRGPASLPRKPCHCWQRPDPPGCGHTARGGSLLSCPFQSCSLCPASRPGEAPSGAHWGPGVSWRNSLHSRWAPLQPREGSAEPGQGAGGREHSPSSAEGDRRPLPGTDVPAEAGRLGVIPQKGKSPRVPAVPIGAQGGSRGVF